MNLDKQLIDKFVSVTSSAAASCYKHIGKGNKLLADKAATDSMRENLNKLILKHNVIFALTHNYSAYPMLREAKEIIANGKIGKIDFISNWFKK